MVPLVLPPILSGVVVGLGETCVLSSPVRFVLTLTRFLFVQTRAGSLET